MILTVSANEDLAKYSGRIRQLYNGYIWNYQEPVIEEQLILDSGVGGMRDEVFIMFVFDQLSREQQSLEITFTSEEFGNLLLVECADALDEYMYDLAFIKNGSVYLDSGIGSDEVQQCYKDVMQPYYLAQEKVLLDRTVIKQYPGSHMVKLEVGLDTARVLLEQPGLISDAMQHLQEERLDHVDGVLTIVQMTQTMYWKLSKYSNKGSVLTSCFHRIQETPQYQKALEQSLAKFPTEDNFLKQLELKGFTGDKDANGLLLEDPLDFMEVSEERFDNEEELIMKSLQDVENELKNCTRLDDVLDKMRSKMEDMLKGQLSDSDSINNDDIDNEQDEVEDPEELERILKAYQSK